MIDIHTRALNIVDQLFEREGYTPEERELLREYVEAARLIMRNAKRLRQRPQLSRKALELAAQITLPIVDAINGIEDEVCRIREEFEELRDTVGAGVPAGPRDEEGEDEFRGGCFLQKAPSPNLSRKNSHIFAVPSEPPKAG